MRNRIWGLGLLLFILLLTGCVRSGPGPIVEGIPATSAGPYPDPRGDETTDPLPFPTPPPTATGEQPTPRTAPPTPLAPAATATGLPQGQTRHVLQLPFVPYSERRVVAERVLIISVDGLHPDAIYNGATGAVNAPFLFSLSQNGAVDWRAQTVQPSTTLPGHASMLSGYNVGKHGINISRYRDILKLGPYLGVPTIFDRAQERGFRTIMIAGKGKLGYFNRPGTLDAVQIFTDKSDEDRFDPEVAAEARKLMQGGFGVMFLHFGDTDSAGHSRGWLSKPYLNTVRKLDRSIQSIFERLESLGLLESTLVIITADHAGKDTGHTSPNPVNRTIPWILYGPEVAPGTALSGIQVMDTTATALWALGIPLPPDLDGRIVLEAFQ